MRQARGIDENWVVVFESDHTATLERVARAQPGPGELIVRHERSVISTGTELTVLSRDFPKGSWWESLATDWRTSGYAAAGVIEEVGEGVSGFTVGDRVTSGGKHAHLWPTSPGPFLSHVPDGVDVETAALARFAQIAMNGVRRASVQWGECAVVFGLGIVGQLAALFARVAGCRPVIGVDISPVRREIAEALGIDLVLDGSVPDQGSTIRGVNNGRDADVIFEATGRGELIPFELELLRPEGRFVILSSPRSPTLLDLHDLCNARSLSIIGAHSRSHPTVTRGPDKGTLSCSSI